MILFSHPILNATARHTAHALSEAGVLGEFWTWLNLPDRLVLQQIPSAALLTPAVSVSAESNTAAEPCVLPGMPTDVSRELDAAMTRRLETETFKGVYAFEHSAESTFRAAGERGLLRIYDLPFGVCNGANPILAEEAAAEPEWAATLTAAKPQEPQRTEAELQQADLVLVGSTFGLQTIEQSAGVNGALAVMPPRATCASASTRTRSPVATGRLRVLFAGPLCQRTGLSYLFRACREFGPEVSLTVMGELPAVECPALRRELSQVRWLPHCTADTLREEMAAHDVFLYPAVFDSSADVLLAALSSGLPVIATPHSAGPDLVRDGAEGFIVPVRSTATIIERLDVLRRDAAQREHMSECARQRARGFTWDRFERTLGASVAAALGRR